MCARHAPFEAEEGADFPKLVLDLVGMIKIKSSLQPSPPDGDCGVHELHLLCPHEAVEVAHFPKLSTWRCCGSCGSQTS